MRIEITVVDLQRDGLGGWCANGCSVDRYEVEVDDDAQGLAVTRAVKKAAGITGWRRDEWTVADFGCWRNGSTGAYAE